MFRKIILLFFVSYSLVSIAQIGGVKGYVKDGNTGTEIENVFIYMTYFAIYIKTVVPHEFEQTVVYKILSKIFQDIFIVLLESYCF